MVNLIGSASSMTGVHALSYALGHVGAEPDLLIVPGYSAKRIDDAKNPVADALEQVSEKLKAVAIFDTGGVSAEDSLKYRADFSSRYTYLVDPFVRVHDGSDIVVKPASAFVSAMFAKKDKMKGGPYWSPSNQEVKGILGTARPITYFDGEIDHEANKLNAAGIATFIPSRLVQNAGGKFAPNGRILWGNRGASEDPIWKFINVVRTRATIEKTLASTFRPWANDENMSSQHVMAIMRNLQSFLDELIAVGAILGGRAFWDRGLNTNAALRTGKLRIEFDAEETPPLEEITETFQPGGSDMEIDIAGLGVKALSLQFKLKSHTPDTIGLFGGAPGIRQNFTGKKLIISEETGKEHEHAIDVVGRLSKIDGEELSAGKATGYDHEIKSIWSYTEYYDNRVMHRFNFKRGGWDIRNFEPVNNARRNILFG